VFGSALLEKALEPHSLRLHLTRLPRLRRLDLTLQLLGAFGKTLQLFLHAALEVRDREREKRRDRDKGRGGQEKIERGRKREREWGERVWERCV